MGATKKPNYYLDSSFILKLFNFSEADSDKILQKLANGDRYASYITLIEFNTGFIGTVLLYRKYIVELMSIPDATAKISNEFSSRTPKNGLILLSILMRLQVNLASSDYLEFVDLLDAAIISMHKRMTRMIKSFIGFYRGHISAVRVVNTLDDLANIPPVNQSQSRPDLIEVWNHYSTEIVELNRKLGEMNLSKKLTVPRRELHELSGMILFNPNVRISHKHRNDLAIALQAGNYKIIAYDKIFKELSPLLNKSGGFVAMPSKPSEI